MPEAKTPSVLEAPEEGEIQLQPLADEPEDDGAESKDAPATPEGEAPVGSAPSSPSVQEFERTQSALRQAQEQQARVEQLLAEAHRAQSQSDLLAKDADELRRYRDELTTQGYDSTDIHAGVQSMEQLQRERQTIAQMHSDLADKARLMAKGAEAKVKLATEFSVKYKVPIADLMLLNHPLEMEIHGLRAQVSALEQGKTMPTQFGRENVEPSAGGSKATRLTSLRNIDRRWTDAEYEEAKSLRT